MNWVVFVRAEAEGDLEVARDWYEQKRSGLGGEFLDEFAAAMRALELNPEREQFYHGHFRRVLFRRYPYKIFTRSSASASSSFACAMQSKITNGNSRERPRGPAMHLRPTRLRGT